MCTWSWVGVETPRRMANSGILDFACTNFFIANCKTLVKMPTFKTSRNTSISNSMQHEMLFKYCAKCNEMEDPSLFACESRNDCEELQGNPSCHESAEESNRMHCQNTHKENPSEAREAWEMLMYFLKNTDAYSRSLNGNNDLVTTSTCATETLTL